MCASDPQLIVLQNNAGVLSQLPMGFGRQWSKVMLADVDNDGLPDVILDNLVLRNRSAVPSSRDRNGNGVPDECEGGVVHVTTP